MNAEILQGFIEEAEGYLPTIRQGISDYQTSKTNLEAIQTAHRQVHTIKGAAMMVGLPEISEIAKELEAELELIEVNNKNLSSKIANQLLMKVTLLEALLTESKNTVAKDVQNELNQELVEEKSENFADNEIEVSENHSESEDSWDEEFEIDEEMQEIFAMEAEDHLRNIASQLEILENQPNHREALMEIRRSAHTLKGSAGICGFTQLSQLAHRAEDLLDYLADNNLESDADIFNVLLASTDCFESLAQGRHSEELNLQIGKLYSQYDEILAKLQEIKTVSAVSEPSEIVEEPEQVLVIEDYIDEEQVALTVVNENEASAEEETAEDLNSNNFAGRAVVRVSLERLDEISKLMSEMVLCHSVFEQRIAQFESQLEELHHTTNRLKRASSRVETDFEASSLQSRHATFSPYSFPSNSNISKIASHFQEFDSLEFDRYTEFHQTTRELIESATDSSAINMELEGLLSSFENLFNQQHRLIDETQEKLLRLRMVPLSSFLSRMQRTVRVTANQEGKLADLHIEGENLEIDTQIVDALAEPLLHLLRNAVAHGIESPDERVSLGKDKKGKVSLRAFSEGTHIVLIISDDGRGLDVEHIKQKAVENGIAKRKFVNKLTDEEAFDLIFQAGLSTASQINEVSGRGVGMEIVKTAIERKQGKIKIKSEKNVGTTFTLRLPMALSVTRSLLIKSYGQTLAFPINLVKQAVEITGSDFSKAQFKGKLRLGEGSYEMLHLNELLGFDMPRFAIETKIPVLLIESPDRQVALIVDQIIKPQEIVIKQLGKPLQNVPSLLGATILGDGSVVPVIDLVYLLNQEKEEIAKPRETKSAVTNRTSVMIVDDSPSVRRVMTNFLTKAGLECYVAKDGLEALETLQYLPALPSIILTDVEMPRMDGYELLASLKRDDKLEKIPVVMITSRAGDKHRQKAHDLGVSEYLTKPYEDSMLLEKIKQLTS
jgi:chemosensory pili system protein ChpA (sensor histidine kinase/response regulator)